jgi:hypothetical protein
VKLALRVLRVFWDYRASRVKEESKEAQAHVAHRENQVLRETQVLTVRKAIRVTRVILAQQAHRVNPAKMVQTERTAHLQPIAGTALF